MRNRAIEWNEASNLRGICLPPMMPAVTTKINPQSQIEVPNSLPLSLLARRETIKSSSTTIKDNISIFLLNACYSETQTEAIADIIDYTIGMNDAIDVMLLASRRHFIEERGVSRGQP